jgi:hypothetical protein
MHPTASDLIALSQLAQQLDTAGGPEGDGDLFEAYLEARESLLARFGLPETPEFVELLELPEGEEATAAQQGVASLHQAAAAYLLSPVQRPVQVLDEARQEGRSGMSVLPELGIATHIYTLFVYDQLFMLGQASAAQVWQALQQTQQPRVLEALGLVGTGEAEGEDAAIFLRAQKIIFLAQFLASLT